MTHFDTLVAYFVCTSNAHFGLRQVMTSVGVFPRKFLSVQNPGIDVDKSESTLKQERLRKRSFVPMLVESACSRPYVPHVGKRYIDI